MILIRVEVAVAALRGIRLTAARLHRRLMTIIRDHHRPPFTRTRDRASARRRTTVPRIVIPHRGATRHRHPLELAKWRRPRLRDTSLVVEEYRIRAQITGVAFRPAAPAAEGVRFIA